MASTQNYNYNFPYFPPYNPHPPPKIAPSHNSPTPPNKPITTPPPPKFPAPPPHHPLRPPTPAAKPPKHSTTPPSPTVKPPPRPIHPPPPSHPSYPPPPYHPIHPPPHIAPTPPPPGHHSNTVIVVIFVSLGGIFFLAFLSVALCCFLKKKKTVQETDIVKIDEHLKIKEAIIPGPHGPQTVILSVEDDVHIQEEIRKNESSVGQGGSHIESVAHHPQVRDLEPSTSGSSPHHHLDQKTAQLR